MSDTKPPDKPVVARYCDRSLHPIPPTNHTVRWKTISSFAGALLVLRDIINHQGVRMWTPDGWVDYVKLNPDVDWSRDKYLQDVEEVWVMYVTEPEQAAANAIAGFSYYGDY